MATQLVIFVMSTIVLKVALGLYAIWLLFPADRRCPNCDSETIAVADVLGFGMVARICRVQRRWCVGCGLPHMARRGRSLSISVRAEPDPTVTPYA